MSPDEQQRWRLEQLEARQDRLDEIVRLEAIERAVFGRRLDEYAQRFADADKRRDEDLEAHREEHKALWQALETHRKLVMGLLVSLALLAVGVAIAAITGGPQ